jgi:hypothetical protein
MCDDDYHGAYSSVFGAARSNPITRRRRTGHTLSEWTIGKFSNENIITSYAFDGDPNGYKNAYPYCTAFGAGETKGGSNMFLNWTIEGFGNNNFIATGGGDSSIFGVGENHGSTNIFNNWAIGNFGTYNTLYGGSSHSTRSTNVSIFGAGENMRSNNGKNDQPIRGFKNWTIGNFSDHNRLVSWVYNCKRAYSCCAFGIGYSSKCDVVTNWTAEFQGNATLASVELKNDENDYFPRTCLNTLGGYRNGNAQTPHNGMRFYFNSQDKTGTNSASVVLCALKLSPTNTIPDGPLSTRIIEQGWENNGNPLYYPRAIALGENFQLNVGRTRIMTNEWIEKAMAHQRANTINGGWETDQSSLRGGVTSTNQNGGILHIVGAIDYAQGNSKGVQRGSCLRIDGGWIVNCFAPVNNLESIEILDGKMVLLSQENSATQASLQEAFDQLSADAIYIDSLHDGTQTIYQNWEHAPYTGDDSPLKNTKPISISSDGYPVCGHLTMGAEQNLVFGIRNGQIVGFLELMGQEERQLWIFPGTHIRLMGDRSSTAATYLLDKEKIIAASQDVANIRSLVTGNENGKLPEFVFLEDDYLHCNNLHIDFDDTQHAIVLTGTVCHLPAP